MGPARYILVLFLQQIWQADFVSLWRLKVLLEKLKGVFYFLPLSSSSISHAARLNVIRYDALFYLSCYLFIIVSNLWASSELFDHRCNNISVSCLWSFFLQMPLRLELKSRPLLVRRAVMRVNKRILRLYEQWTVKLVSHWKWNFLFDRWLHFRLVMN